MSDHENLILSQFTIELKPTNYFDERARSEFLQKCLEVSMVPEVTVFNTAWLIEKDLSEFYEKMSNQTERKAEEAFKMLSSGEKEHKSSSVNTGTDCPRSIPKCPGEVNF